MSRNAKRWLIASVILVLLGVVVFVTAFLALGFDFKKISTQKYEKNTYELKEEFDNISIDISTAKVTLAVSEDGSCKVECLERAKEKSSVVIEDGTLVIQTVDTRKWYEKVFDFEFYKYVVSISLPKADYDSLQIGTDVGDVEVPGGLSFRSIDIACDTGNIMCNASASEQMEIRSDVGKISLSAIDTDGSINVKADTGDISFTDIKCGSFAAESNIGNVILKNVVSKGMFSAKTDTGDVKFDGCDGASVLISTDIGDVEGTFLTDKIIFAESSLGSVNVPKSTTGGQCEISADTGDIKIKIAQ